MTDENAYEPWLDDASVYLFNEGTNTRVYRHLGAHLDPDGVRFAVWAPNARHVGVIHDGNGWDPSADPMFPTGSGIWRTSIPGMGLGAPYKFAITGPDGVTREKADPYAFTAEVPPKSGSVVWNLDYEWGDGEWMGRRSAANGLEAPMSIYEVHVGSWRKKEGRIESFSYRELAPRLADYVTEMGFTHVEFLPVTEHPYYPSWGYQTTGYFAPTSRFGTPQDLMFLIDQLHQAGVGVILDWVPSHFASDGHGLAYFDGTHLYEHADPRLGWHPDWQSAVFNYGRNEVRSFLLSSAMFWLDVYHVDGLRVDAVASMLYLDYSRDEGEWLPNAFGGREHLEAVSLLRDLNRHAYAEHPDIVMIAEESTAWPGVSRPVDVGGLGFGLKWDMGWMHDTLSYFAKDPIYRAHHQDTITFRMIYAFDENFVLSLSHDEVVHGKGSLVNKQPGDEWQQFANLRALYGYMYGLPGKQLMFMGSEFGQRSEWAIDTDLDWYVLDYPHHAGLREYVKVLNSLHRTMPALHEIDFDPEGFQWIDAGDAAASVLSFARFARDGDTVVVVCNFTPIPRGDYRIGVPAAGDWAVLLNSDSPEFWGSGSGSTGVIRSEERPTHGRDHSIELDLPPLGVLYLAPADGSATIRT